MTNDSPPSQSEVKPCECLALVVADNVIQEAGTGKLYVLGTFDKILAPQYPARHDRFHLYIAISDMIPGKRVGRIRIDYLDEERTPLVEAQGPIVAQDRLQFIELNFGFRGIVFPKPGSLEISFFVDDQWVKARKFELEMLPKQEA